MGIEAVAVARNWIKRTVDISPPLLRKKARKGGLAKPRTVGTLKYLAVLPVYDSYSIMGIFPLWNCNLYPYYCNPGESFK